MTTTQPSPKPEFPIVPLRSRVWTERNQLRYVWDYRRDDSAVPFLADNNYFESCEHWLVVSGQRKKFDDDAARSRRQYVDGHQPECADISGAMP